MRYLLTTGLLVLAGACGNSSDEPPEAPEVSDSAGAAAAEEVPPEQAPLLEVVSPLADADPLTPGTYCYFRDDENVTEGLEVNVMEGGAVSGDNFGIIHQEAADYYASFSTTLSDGQLGTRAAVTFKTETRVEGDVQNSSAIWYLSEDGAVPDGLDSMLEPAACEGLEERVWEDGAP